MSCPICQKNTNPAFKPFCCKRCADVDLGRWFNGSYAIPAEDQELSEEDEIALSDALETRH